nr:hypothetical protein [Tanacetum cinerariifolium]
MAVTFANTHNMIAYLTKSDASKGFNQIIDFLNASSIKYALTVNPDIYVSCIKQFWSSVSVKKVNDVIQLQALIDRKKEIFTELSRMGYKKPSTKLTFYKAFCSAQQKFLIHTVLHCMTTKRTSWNEFSSSMASAIIYLSIGRKFNFSKAQVGDLSSHTTKYSSPDLTQKQADNVADEVATGVDVDDVHAADVEPTLPSPTPTTQPPPPPQKLPCTSQGEIIANIDKDENFTLKDVADDKVKENADDDESEPAELKEVVELVTIAKLMTEVVNVAVATITAANTPINAATKKTKEQLEEEESRALKRTSESLEEKAAKKQKLDEEVEKLKKQLQIVPNDDDDVYTEATPLALKVPVVDYEIYTEKNKPYYKIIRVDVSHQLFLSFLSLLTNFDKEDLEVLWQLVKERFASSKPRNYSDDFLLTTLIYMFEKPDVEAQV